MWCIKQNNLLARKAKNGSLPENLLSPVKPTLVANMERAVELAKALKLDDRLYSVAHPYLGYIAERMSLTEKQALLLSLFLEKSGRGMIGHSDLADMVSCSTIRIISLMSEVDALIDRGLIRRRRECSDGSVSYRIPVDVVLAIKDNVVYKPESTKGLSVEEFFDRMRKIFDNYEVGDNITRTLDVLLEDNMHLEFCKQAKAFHLSDDSERLLFYVFCSHLVNEDDDKLSEWDWSDYFGESKSMLRTICGRMQNNSGALFSQHIITNCNSDGMADLEFFQLTDTAKEKLFSEIDIKQQAVKYEKELLKYTTLSEKRLFYNPREHGQIEQLSDLLMPEKFLSVQKRLEENGMRKGFACLFYGSPGTGKTETVYQLARRTQRDLMMVDVSRIKSSWVGESEKNIKAAFSRYGNYVKQCERAPILLFNEADAVLGIRQEGAQRAVDKMENSIQNIILQEMEQLDGIMIATTNLTQNLDKAFERRFVYKIEFSRPSIEAKRAIWQTMIPNLATPLADELATAYDFSGGQIENIARKRTVELILSGEEPTADKMHEMCRSEQWGGCDTRQRIGFSTTRNG